MRVDLLVVQDCPSDWAASEMVATAIGELGIEATTVRTVVTSVTEAERLDFAGSPTILVDGVDLFERSGPHVGLACRLYPSDDGPRGVPSYTDLLEAISRLNDRDR